MNSSYLDIFDVKVKYWRQPRGDKTTIYYKRRIPSDLLAHYGNQTMITVSTKLNNIQDATPALFRINQSVEAQWEAMREQVGLGLNPHKTNEDAFAFLNNFDINRKGEGSRDAVLLAGEALEDKLPYEAKARLYELEVEGSQDMDDMRLAVIKEYLAPHELVAANVLSGEFALLLSDYTKPYSELKGFDADSKQFKDVTRAVKLFTERFGDRPPHKYSRSDINDLIKYRLYSGTSTGTIERNFNALNAMINKVNIEYEIDEIHRFSKPNIPKKGEDKKERNDFSAEQINTLRLKLSNSEGVADTLIKIMLDTGMRVSEVVGLGSGDVFLNVESPYIVLHKNSFRRLKTKNSERVIPLVGAALEVMKSLDLSGEWLFPRYLNESKQVFKFTSASNTANNRIRSLLESKGSPTSHSFRHTMQTRLRNVECPEDIREEILGWRSGISERYGSPTDIDIKARYMLKTL